MLPCYRGVLIPSPGGGTGERKEHRPVDQIPELSVITHVAQKYGWWTRPVPADACLCIGRGGLHDRHRMWLYLRNGLVQRAYFGGAIIRGCDILACLAV
jgi:hypothetical protein